MVFELIQPIFGFEEIKKVEVSKIDDYFIKLTSKGTGESISFTLIDPLKIREYEVTLPSFFKSLLQINDSSKVLIYNIMVVHAPIEDSTIDFIAPLVFNVDKKLAAQVMLDTIKYQHYGVAEKVADYLILEDN